MTPPPMRRPSPSQALPTSAAETLLDNIAKLFQLSITPQEWIDNMNKAIVK